MSVRFVKFYGIYRICINDKESGMCNFVYSDDESNTIYINCLQIYNAYQGKGYGTVLLYEVLKDAYELYGKTRVELSDMSDKWGETDNIYKKIGIVYKNNPIDDEMVGNLRHILFGLETKKCKRIKQFYESLQ
jgi:GNAT superfamily N-acetyltransferase